jgi:hypothetical protein
MSTPEESFKDTISSTTIKGMMEGGYKTVFIKDAAGRIEIAYEAPINADIGDPCLRTKLKYVDGAGGTDRGVIAEEEDIVAWPGYEILSGGAGNDIDNLA